MLRQDRYDSLLAFYSSEYGLPFALVKAQMLAESNANPTAVSHVGAKGLAQFMPATWDDIADAGDDPFNPEHSIRAQCRYMQRLLHQFHGDTVAALAAYNWGPGNVAEHMQHNGRLIPEKLPEETSGYVARIGRKRGEIEGVVRHA